jgi:hypothetical protein
VRHEGKDALPFDDNPFSSGRPAFYDRNTGEAETGSAGEQPDRGIAGAELIADDEKGVVLPTRSFAWVTGPTSGRRSVSGPGFGFDFDFGFGFGLEPHRTDRFRPSLENAY